MKYAILDALPLHPGTGRRCMQCMNEIAVSFLLSVAAGVVCHYLCRWLDERVNGNKPER
nr:MAG TPA: toxin [Caudoviricetes sp.]